VPRVRPHRPLARLAGAALIALALVAAGCGGDEDVSRKTFADDFRERTTLPKRDATCITDAIYDEFGQAEINKIYRAGSEDELADDTREKLDEINQTCLAGGDEGAGDDEGSTTTTEAVPTTEGTGTTGAPGETTTTTAPTTTAG